MILELEIIIIIDVSCFMKTLSNWFEVAHSFWRRRKKIIAEAAELKLNRQPINKRILVAAEKFMKEHKISFHCGVCERVFVTLIFLFSSFWRECQFNNYLIHIYICVYNSQRISSFLCNFFFLLDGIHRLTEKKEIIIQNNVILKINNIQVWYEKLFPLLVLKKRIKDSEREVNTERIADKEKSEIEIEKKEKIIDHFYFLNLCYKFFN